MNTQQLIAESVSAFIIGFGSYKASRPMFAHELSFINLSDFLPQDYQGEEIHAGNELVLADPALYELGDYSVAEYAIRAINDEQDTDSLQVLFNTVTPCLLHVQTGIVYVSVMPDERYEDSEVNGVEYQLHYPGFYASLSVSDDDTARTREDVGDVIEYHQLAVEQGELVQIGDTFRGHQLVKSYGKWRGERASITPVAYSDGLYFCTRATHPGPVATEQGFLFVSQ